MKRVKRLKGIKNNGGFSLVEVLVAVAILALVSLPILNSFMSSSKLNKSARQTENCNAVGQLMAERCKSLSVSKLLSSVSSAEYGFDEVKKSDFAGQKIYTFNSVALDSNGNKYTDASEGDKFYVQVTLDPTGYADTGSASDNKNNNINSYNMPSFTDVQNDKNYAVMSQVFEHDNQAPGELGIPAGDIHREVEINVVSDKTSKIIDGSSKVVYTQKVTMSVTYSSDDGSKKKSYDYNIGSNDVLADDVSSGYKNIYLFYNPYDCYSSSLQVTAEGKLESKDKVTFNITNNTGTTTKQMGVYLVEQSVKNISSAASHRDKLITLTRNNICVKINSIPYTATTLCSAGSTLKIGNLVNLFSNAEALRIYSTVTDKTIDKQTNSLTQDVNQDTEIKYLYNMSVKIWINAKPDSGEGAFLTLNSTKEN